MKPMTKNMLRCLNKLNYKKWQSACEISENLITLFALRKRGLIISNAKLGSYVYPRTRLLWRLKTNSGEMK